VLFANDAPAALGSYPLAVSGLVRVSDTTTYLTVSCWQQTGSTGSLAFNSTQGETSFWAYKVTNTVA